MKYLSTFFVIILLISCSSETKIKKRLNENKTLYKNSINMSFVKIDPGEFVLGCSKNDNYCGKDELPNQKIKITKTLYVSIYETTIEQFNKFLKDTKYQPTEKYLINKKYGPNYPVANVNYNDVQKFIEWINNKEKDKVYRLPTEYEWEYLCKAGSNSSFCYGNEAILLRSYAWFWNNSEKKPHEVGLKKPNNWGLYDIHGNVYEWTSSWYNSEYYKNIELIDPKGPKIGDKKVYRGGGYLCNPDYCRSSFRNYAPVEKTVESVGFRLIYQIKN